MPDSSNVVSMGTAMLFGPIVQMIDVCTGTSESAGDTAAKRRQHVRPSAIIARSVVVLSLPPESHFILR